MVNVTLCEFPLNFKNGKQRKAVSSGTGLGKGMTCMAWRGGGAYGGRKVRTLGSKKHAMGWGWGRCGPLGEAALRNERDKVSRHPRKDC